MIQAKVERRELLLNPLHQETNTCLICLDIVISPVRCTKCSTIYCATCASNWRMSSDFCPKKCQSPWLFNRVPSDSSLLLRCPYSEKCAPVTPEKLNNHVLNCDFAPGSIREQNRQKREFLCKNNHKLEFRMASFQELVNSICASCKQKGNCRAECLKCSETYCTSCRFPQCSKTSCPFGHKYIHLPKGFDFLVCDCCQLKPSFFGEPAYIDRRCNFGLCQTCYNNAPQSNASEQKVLYNDHKMCDKNHPLGFLQQKVVSVKCAHCLHENTVSWRKCETCNQHYCARCKAPEVTFMTTCPFGHHWTDIQMGECCMCGGIGEMREDQDCGFKVCYYCLQKLVAAQVDKYVILEGCPKGHSLLENIEESQMEQQCSICKLFKLCPLLCEDCDQQDITYFCATCIPNRETQLDYLGHPLLPSEDIERCVKCMEQRQHTKGCVACNYYICQDCLAPP